MKSSVIILAILCGVVAAGDETGEGVPRFDFTNSFGRFLSHTLTSGVHRLSNSLNDDNRIREGERRALRSRSLDTIDIGDWIVYDLNVPRDGKYNMKVSLTSTTGMGAFMVINRLSQLVYGKIRSISPSPRSQTVEVEEVSLSAGALNLQVLVLQGGFRIHSFTIEEVVDQTMSALGGTSVGDTRESTAPESKTVDSEKFIDGSTIFIPASMYSEMSGIEVEDFTDSIVNGVETLAGKGTTKNVCWIDRGDWLRYDIRIPTSGTYRLTVCAASPEGYGSMKFYNWGNHQLIARIDTLPETGWWQTWGTASTTLDLEAGDLSFTMRTSQSGFNLLWLKLELN